MSPRNNLVNEKPCKITKVTGDLFSMRQRYIPHNKRVNKNQQK